MTKSMPSSTCTASCSSKVRRTRSYEDGLPCSYIQVSERLPATRQWSPATSRRDAHGRAVEVLEPVLEADRRELVAAGVEGQRLEHVGARLAKLDVELPQRLGPRQRDLGRERAGAHPAALLELQQIAAVAEDRALRRDVSRIPLSSLVTSRSSSRFSVRIRLQNSNSRLSRVRRRFFVAVFPFGLDGSALREAVRREARGCPRCSRARRAAAPRPRAPRPARS